MTLQTTLKTTLALSSRVAADLGSSSATRALNYALALADGTGAGQADRAFADTRTLAASGTEDLDLAGSLGGVDGSTAVFARVKAIVISADPDNTNNVRVTRPASNGAPLFLAAGDGVDVRPGGVLVLAVGDEDATGYAVTASTGDLITVTNSAAGSSVTYSIAVVGCSA
jgi:hypothetical protein